MRLDIFLKGSRLAKRRAVAQELCGSGLVDVNGQPAKPAKEVRPGDSITLRFTSRTIEIRVLALPLPGRKVQPEPCYVVTGETRTEMPELS